MPAQSEALECIFHVLDLYLAAPQSTKDHRFLRNAIVNSMRSHRQAYPDSAFFPKWHKALHTVGKECWSAFTPERKHKVFKREATQVENLRSFERTVTEALLNHQLNTFNCKGNPWSKTGTFLLEPTTLLDGQVLGLSQTVRTARAASHNMLRTARGDFVEIQEGPGLLRQVGRVELHVECTRHGTFVVISEFSKTEAGDRYVAAGKACLIPIHAILRSLIWTPAGSGVQFAWPPIRRKNMWGLSSARPAIS